MQLHLDFQDTFFYSLDFTGAMYDILMDLGWTIEDACRATRDFHLTEIRGNTETIPWLEKTLKAVIHDG